MKTLKKFSVLLLVMALFTTLFSINTSAQETSMDSSGQIEIGGVYRIKNVNSGKYLTIVYNQNESSRIYNNAVQCDRRSSADQFFQITITDNGKYKFMPLSLPDMFLGSFYDNIIGAHKGFNNTSARSSGTLNTWTLEYLGNNTYNILQDKFDINIGGSSIMYALTAIGLSEGTYEGGYQKDTPGNVCTTLPTGGNEQKWVLEKV